MPAAPARSAFLAGLVDYAGLFPPAALALDEAAAAYAADRAGADAWMLGRFVVPAATLPKLDAHGERLGTGLPWQLAVLGGAPEADDDGVVSAAAWLRAAEATLDAAAEADRELGTVSDRFELRLPPETALDPDALVEALGEVARRLAPEAAVALEVPFRERPETAEPAAHAAAEANRKVGEAAGAASVLAGRGSVRAVAPFALKLRCGGETAETVPTVEGLAAAITVARRAGAAFKATAGLHHPLRGMADAGGAPMHGFVNVFGGAALAARHGLDADALAELLDDGRPDRWRLDDAALAWGRLALTPDEVAHARTHVALSFGSCSFAEPRADLQSLGWL